MRTPKFDMNIFKKRRDEFAKHVSPGSVLILPSHPEYIRNHDVHHSYRQDSNLFYLTGFEEPESILVFRPGQTPESIMFVRAKDEERETWDGFRYGPEGVAKNFLINKCYLIADFDKEIVGLLKDSDRIYYHWAIDHGFDQKMISILERTRLSHGRSGRGQLPMNDSWEVLGEMRSIKSNYEIEVLRKAGEISAKAHVAAMKFTKPGVNERQIHGVLMAAMFGECASREGYGTIVATGNNATTLHYVFNDQICKDGELILIDAGAEYDYYTGDITRTFPVNGKFSVAQKKVYEGVLAVQKDLIEMIKPGLPFKDLQDTAIDRLTELMIELKLLTGHKDELIKSLAFKKYYPHGVSHFLGMDVHDSGRYMFGKEPRQLEPGVCFTIEPGLYIPENDTSAPAELRGIGIRIEDNIVVTQDGYENLTKLAPKEIHEIEALMAR